MKKGRRVELAGFFDGDAWRLVTFEDPDFDPGFATDLPLEGRHILQISIFADNANTVTRTLVADATADQYHIVPEPCEKTSHRMGNGAVHPGCPSRHRPERANVVRTSDVSPRVTGVCFIDKPNRRFAADSAKPLTDSNRRPLLTIEVRGRTPGQAREAATTNVRQTELIDPQASVARGRAPSRWCSLSVPSLPVPATSTLDLRTVAWYRDTEMARKNMTLRLPAEQADELEAVARAEGISVSDAVREAIAEHIARKRKDKAFRERLRAVVERDREILERLAR
jgi:hypothetical protein